MTQLSHISLSRILVVCLNVVCLAVTGVFVVAPPAAVADPGSSPNVGVQGISVRGIEGVDDPGMEEIEQGEFADSWPEGDEDPAGRTIRVGAGQIARVENTAFSGQRTT